MVEAGWKVCSRREIEHSVSSFPGIYLLRKHGARCFIGRSDKDVRAQMLAQAVSEYDEYWVFYLPTGQEAFENECRLWHELGGEQGVLENREHPVVTAGTGWWCPVCEKSILLRALLTHESFEPLLVPLGLTKRSPVVD